MSPTSDPSSSHRSVDLAALVIVFIGLQQGLVPLGLRLAIGHRERSALATYLPSPWWWIACLVIVFAAVALLMLVDTARREDAGSGSRAATEGDVAGDCAPVASTPPGLTGPEGRDTDAVSGFVLLVGIYNGVVPFLARLVLDTQLLLAFPTRLPAPWWWLVSVGVCIGTVVALRSLDRAGSRRSTDG